MKLTENLFNLFAVIALLGLVIAALVWFVRTGGVL